MVKTTYVEFCRRYELDPDSADGRQQYRDYKEAHRRLVESFRRIDAQAAAEADKADKSQTNTPGRPAD